MNDVIRQLIDRKSIRVYTDAKISDEDKRQILLAAVNAPTAGNQQMYSIIEITDEDTKLKLSKSCDNQPFIASAKWVLIFVADYRKWYDVFEETGCTPRHPEAGDLMLSVCDAMIAAQNAVTAAESLGIGSCYIGDIMEQCEYHKELLDLPEYTFPVGMLVFGYPTEGQLQRVKPTRCSIDDILMHNRYERKTGPELRSMFKNRTDSRPLDEYMQAFCKRKYNSDFSIEMSRSVNEYLKSFRNDAR